MMQTTPSAPPSFGQVLLSATLRAILPAAGLSILFVAIKFTYLLVQALPTSAEMFVQAGQIMLAAWALLFAFFLILSSRTWSDRVFTASGFFATFFGLAILGVFFYQLGAEVVEWFHYTPIMVEQQNLKNQKVLDEFKQRKKASEQGLLALMKERDDALRDAKTDEEKKELRELFEFGIEQHRNDMKKIMDEDDLIASRSLRPDTSSSGIFLYFLSNSPSKDPQDSGIGPALWGSIWLGVITVLFAVPIGVGAAIYLEEYRQEGFLARVIQVNINNLAGVPSVVYGILGGFVFVYIFKQVNRHFPDVDPFNLLGGGLTLGLLTLPVVIVSAQEAIRAVPGSLRHGAYALGATKWQVIWSIVLPMARPGILTGMILSLSRAIGEAAPLVLFGAQQYVDRDPTLFKPFTALPLQIFQWCGEPGVIIDGEADSVEIWKFNAAVASTVLLVVLLGMNAVAIFVRQRAHRRTSE